MPTVRGKEEVKAFFANIPPKLTNVLRGAARAGGKVIAEEIKLQTPSEKVREAVRITSRAGDGEVKVKIDLKPGWARSLGIWLEYGTSPHFISVDDSQRQGKSVRKLNTQVAEYDGNASLVIGGNFVGETVFHPGARPYPAFRPALDTKEQEAISAAQSYVNARVSRAGINAGSGGGDE